MFLSYCREFTNFTLAGFRNTSNIGGNFEYVGVSEVIVHESYDEPNRFSHDIALMKLERPVEFSDYIRPVCLNTEANETAIYTNCYATGWGRTAEGGKCLHGSCFAVYLDIHEHNITFFTFIKWTQPGVRFNITCLISKMNHFSVQFLVV